jgi:hypothetical protein
MKLHNEYGQSWFLAAALIDGPRTADRSAAPLVSAGISRILPQGKTALSIPAAVGYNRRNIRRRVDWHLFLIIFRKMQFYRSTGRRQKLSR